MNLKHNTWYLLKHDTHLSEARKKERHERKVVLTEITYFLKRIFNQDKVGDV